MRVHDYSTSVGELLRNGMSFDTTMERLTQILKKRGHTALYPKILRTLIRDMEREEARDTITVTVAKEADLDRFKDAITKGETVMKGAHRTTKTDETIIGGFIIENRETRIDNSYKKRLLTLYRSLTTS